MTPAQHGDEPKSSHLHIRVTQEQKARWVKKAQARGKKLSTWVCERLDDDNDVELWGNNTSPATHKNSAPVWGF